MHAGIIELSNSANKRNKRKETKGSADAYLFLELYEKNARVPLVLRTTTVSEQKKIESMGPWLQNHDLYNVSVML